MRSYGRPPERLATGSICSALSSIGAWPTPANSTICGLGPAGAHRGGRFARTAGRIRRRAAAASGNESRPRPATGRARRRSRRAKRYGDAGIVLEPPASVRGLARSGAREFAPLRIGQRSERRGNLAHVRLERGEGLELGIEPDIAGDARERRGLDHRSDVVDHEPGHRRVALRGDHHAEQPAHRGAHPGDTASTSACASSAVSAVR